MSKISRRHFLATASAAATAGGIVLDGRPARAEPAPEHPRPTKGTDRVTLGRTGLKPTVLGIGTGTRGGREQREMGQADFTRLVHHAYERGVRYIDTADMYRMHVLVAFAMEGLPREEFFLQTKTRAKHPEVARADIERFRKELQTDYLDTVLMHCMTNDTYPVDLRPVMDVLTEAKEKGRVRAVGISQHGMDPLLASVDCDWIEVQLTRINPFGAKMDGKPEEVLPIMKKVHDAGRGMLGMKVFGESGFENRQQRFESLKYVLDSGCVDAFTIGFSTTDQLDETLDLIEEALAVEQKLEPVAA